MLREIFDESAYERFCAGQSLPKGRESYALFLQRRPVKVKCC